MKIKNRIFSMLLILIMILNIGIPSVLADNSYTGNIKVTFYKNTTDPSLKNIIGTYNNYDYSSKKFINLTLNDGTSATQNDLLTVSTSAYADINFDKAIDTSTFTTSSIQIYQIYIDQSNVVQYKPITCNYKISPNPQLPDYKVIRFYFDNLKDEIKNSRTYFLTVKNLRFQDGTVLNSDSIKLGFYIGQEVHFSFSKEFDTNKLNLNSYSRLISDVEYITNQDGMFRLNSVMNPASTSYYNYLYRYDNDQNRSILDAYIKSGYINPYNNEYLKKIESLKTPDVSKDSQIRIKFDQSLAITQNDFTLNPSVYASVYDDKNKIVDFYDLYLGTTDKNNDTIILDFKKSMPNLIENAVYSIKINSNALKFADASGNVDNSYNLTDDINQTFIITNKPLTNYIKEASKTGSSADGKGVIYQKPVNQTTEPENSFYDSVAGAVYFKFADFIKSPLKDASVLNLPDTRDIAAVSVIDENYMGGGLKRVPIEIPISNTIGGTNVAKIDWSKVTSINSTSVPAGEYSLNGFYITYDKWKYNEWYILKIPKRRVRDLWGNDYMGNFFPFDYKNPILTTDPLYTLLTTDYYYYRFKLLPSPQVYNPDNLGFNVVLTTMDLLNNYIQGRDIRGVFRKNEVALKFDREMVYQSSKALNDEVKVYLKNNGQSTLLNEDGKDLDFKYEVGTEPILDPKNYNKTVTEQTYTKISIKPKADSVHWLPDSDYSVVVPANNTFEDTNGYPYQGGEFTFKTVQDDTCDPEIFKVVPSSISRKYPVGQRIDIYGRNFASDSVVTAVYDPDGNKVLSAKDITSSLIDSRHIVMYLNKQLEKPNDLAGNYTVVISSQKKKDNGLDRDYYSSKDKVYLVLNELAKPIVTSVTVGGIGIPIATSTSKLPIVNELNLNVTSRTIMGNTVPVVQITFSGDYDDLNVAVGDIGAYITVSRDGLAGSNLVDFKVLSDLQDLISKYSDNSAMQEALKSYVWDKTTKTLYVPITGLESGGIKYNIDIMSGLIKNDSILVVNDQTGTFSFITGTYPNIVDVETGYITVDYQAGSFIKVNGEFIPNVTALNLLKVDLPSTNSGISIPIDWNRSDASTLIGTLPTSPRLEKGLYKVRVSNDNNHTSKNLGYFGVVELKNMVGTIPATMGSVYINADTVINNSVIDISSYDMNNIIIENSALSKLNGVTLKGKNFSLNISSITAVNIKDRYTIVLRNFKNGLSNKDKTIEADFVNINSSSDLNIKGSIKMKYNDDYLKDMGIYYLNKIKNKWIQLNMQNNNDKLNKYITADLMTLGINGDIYFGIFR